MKIAYVSLGDPRDVRYWSGTSYWTVRKLRDAGHDVTVVGPLSRALGYIYAFHKMVSRLRGTDIHIDRFPLMTRSFAKQIRRMTSSKQFDIILSDSSIPIADLLSPVPVLFWTDAVVDMMIDFYQERYWRMEASHLKLARTQEQHALTRCAYAIYASEWAANGVLERYQVDPRKVIVRPFGPNLDIPGEDSARQGLVDEITHGICRFLYIGADWKRKGGELVYRVIAALREHGVDAHLTIVGASPFAEADLPPFVTQEGFIDKASAHGCFRLMQLYASSHFFIMPSSAEAMGVVFVEAAGFGLPSIATRVGGIPTVVRDGRTGLLFDTSAGPREYVERIKGLIEHPHAYRRLREDALAEFREHWSWPNVIRDIELLAERAKKQSSA